MVGKLVTLVALTAALATRLGVAGAQTPAYYPPTRTGMRGSHPGSYEVAHALARQGAQFDDAVDTGEHYDLVIVGAGISGLADAHYYR